MRDAIKEYLGYTEKEKRDLWKHATFVFDTNVFLNLYRYTAKTRNKLMSAFDHLNERLWMPNHVAREFMRNRCNIIFEACKQYDDLHKEAEKFMNSCKESLHLEPDDKDFVEVQEKLNGWLDSAKGKNIIVNDPDSDSILEKILSLFEGKVGIAFSEEEMLSTVKEGRERYSNGTPPGYMDSKKQKGNNSNNSFGDYIVWKQILNYAKSEKKDVVLVTNDQKEDWWNIVHGRTLGPRIELRKEFIDETNQRFHMYSMRSFLTRFESENNNQIDKNTIDEIEFFSKVIRHKTPRSDLKKYYQSFDNKEEARAAKLRYEIMRLKKKNQKRKNSIGGLSEKYTSDNMPEEIKTLIENNIKSITRDEARITELETELEALLITSPVLII